MRPGTAEHHYSDQLVAMVCHDAIAGLQKANEARGTPDSLPSGPFLYLHRDLLDAAVSGVTEARRGEALSPREHHDRWVAFLAARGWARGPKDPEGKTHPNLVAWHELPPGEQVKDRMFLGIVISMTLDAGEY